MSGKQPVQSYTSCISGAYLFDRVSSIIPHFACFSTETHTGLIHPTEQPKIGIFSCSESIFMYNNSETYDATLTFQMSLLMNKVTLQLSIVLNTVTWQPYQQSVTDDRR